MIANLKRSTDGAGFPIVAWTERRGTMSPAGVGEFRMECRITKDGRTGELLFTARGKTRNRSFEAARPWESLESFGFQSAVKRFRTPVENHTWQTIGKHMKSAGGLLGDGGTALVAEFINDSLFDVSCPETTEVERDTLHLALQQEFLTRRSALIDEHCRDLYRWPLTDGRVETHDPERKDWADASPLPRWLDLSVWLLVAGIFAALAAGFAWLVGLI